MRSCTWKADRVHILRYTPSWSYQKLPRSWRFTEMLLNEFVDNHGLLEVGSYQVRAETKDNTGGGWMLRDRHRKINTRQRRQLIDVATQDSVSRLLTFIEVADIQAGVLREVFEAEGYSRKGPFLDAAKKSETSSMGSRTRALDYGGSEKDYWDRWIIYSPEWERKKRIDHSITRSFVFTVFIYWWIRDVFFFSPSGGYHMRADTEAQTGSRVPMDDLHVCAVSRHKLDAWMRVISPQNKKIVTCLYFQPASSR